MLGKKDPPAIVWAGGAKYIYKYAGKVATGEFTRNHPVTIIRQTLPNGATDNFKGSVDLSMVPGRHPQLAMSPGISWMLLIISRLIANRGCFQPPASNQTPASRRRRRQPSQPGHSTSLRRWPPA